jgi:hypothetical protein
VNAISIDLRKPSDYMSSLARLRQQIEFVRNGSSAARILQLDVHCPEGGSATVFLQTSNLYILAFRGRGNQLYVLADAGDEFIDKLVEAGAIRDRKEAKPITLRSDHGSLGTANLKFNFMHLYQCGLLSDYSGGPYEQVKTWLSLLVCMIAEGARFLKVQNAFAGIGREDGEYWPRPLPGHGVYGGEVEVGDIVNYWKDASDARQLAAKAGLGVRQAKVLTNELEKEIAILQELMLRAGHTCERNDVIEWILAARKDTLMDRKLGEHASIKKARELAQKLKFRDLKATKQFLTLYKQEMAIDAASGLLLPAV